MSLLALKLPVEAVIINSSSNFRISLLIRISLIFEHLQTEQTLIRQLLQELPDQGLLCLLMEI